MLNRLILGLLHLLFSARRSKIQRSLRADRATSVGTVALILLQAGGAAPVFKDGPSKF